MASSSTHFSAAIAFSGVAATSVLVAGLSTPREAVIYLGLGTVGGCLPDVDADNSRPLKAAFHWGAVLLAFLALFAHAGRYSVVELLVLWTAIYLGVRVVAVRLFERLTVHRGLFHSIPAAGFFAALSALLMVHGFALPARVAWLGAVFLAASYALHLLLDELHALNWFGVGARRSLGSALKFWSRDNPKGTLLLYGLTALCLALASPPAQPFGDVPLGEAWQRLFDSFWPADRWFEPLYGLRSFGRSR